VAIDRPSKVAFAEVQPRATKIVAADFLRRVLAARPYKVHKVLTDHGTQFGNRPHQPYAGRHLFDRVCDEHGLEHRFPKPAHPWTNAQGERLNRPLKEATVRPYHSETTEHLNEHWQAFLLAYHHAKRRKTLSALTPHAFVCAQGQNNPSIFTRDPTHLTLGLYI
jgi:transposase InsO family protein